MIKQKLKIFFALFIIALGCFISPSIALAGFGISPGMIIQEHLKPGAKVEQDVVVSRSDPDEDLIVKIEPELKEMASWFSFEPHNEIEMPAGQQNITIKVIINVPKDAEYKNYQGVIRIMGSPKLQPGGGVSVVKGARMEVELITTNLDVNQLIVRDMSFEKLAGNDPLKLNLKIENNGNTKIAPSKVTVEILDLQQRYIETLETKKLDSINPNETQNIVAQFDTTVGSGEYFANVEIFLKNKSIRKDRLVFEVTGRAAGTRGQVMLQTALNTFKQIGQNSSLFKLVGLATGINAIVLFIIVKKKRTKSSKSSKSKKSKKNKKRTSNYNKALFISSLSFTVLAIFFVLSLVFANKKNKQQPVAVQPIVNDNKDILEEPTENSPAEETDASKVKGWMDEEIESVYEIYQEPNYGSEIIYLAQENETFEVIDQQPDWYYVRLVNDKQGWLPKKNVIKEQEVRQSD